MLLAGTTLLLHLSLAADPAALDDEIWIESQMSPNSQLAPRRTGPDRIPVSDLHRFVGSNVRIRLVNGREREGIVEGVEEGRLLLRSRMGGGYARFDLALDQIASSELRR